MSTKDTTSAEDAAEDVFATSGPEHDDDQPGRKDDGEEGGEGNGARGKDKDKGERKERPGRHERNMGRVFKMMEELRGEIRKGGASKELIERLDRLEAGQGEIRKTADPKPKLKDFDDAEDFAEALEGWHDRNPKGADKSKDKGDDKDKKGGNDRNATPEFTTEAIAQALSVTLEELEDFQEDQEDARDKFEDYDEVMTAGKDLPRTPLMTRCLILDDRGAEVNYWLAKHDKKEFRRIAALTRKRDVVEALESVRERMDEDPEPDADEDPADKKRPMKPLKSKTPPRSKGKDVSTESWEEFEARRKKELRGGGN